MALKELDIDRETFSCSICLDLLKDPVTIPCGHSYCMSCVSTHWNGEVGKQSYSCPQCRQSFTQRPALVKNTMLAALMEGLQKSGAPAAVVCPSSPAQREVFCDLCSGKKVKADKSCLQCLVSYCKEHLQPHYDVAVLKKHKLVEPTENLQDNICSRHDEVMKMFCRTDQQCICYLCSVDQHKGHDTVTAAAERAEKQKELQAFRQNFLQRIDLKHKDVDSLQYQLKNSSHSADAAVKLIDRNLKELVQLLEKRINELNEQIITQQEAEEQRVRDLQDKVQQDISELQMKFTELDTLSHTEDHIQFLQRFTSLPKVSETSDSLNSSQSLPPFQDMVTAAVSKLKSSLQETSLRDPSTVAHKPKVSTSKTDALPTGAQATAVAHKPKVSISKTDALPTAAQAAAVAHKPKVSTSKTDALPTGAQATAVVHKPKVRTSKTCVLPSGDLATVPSQQNSSEKLPALPKSQTSDSQLQNLPPQPFYFGDLLKLEDLKHVDLQLYSRRLTFDPQSLNYELKLFKGDTVVKCLPKKQHYPPDPHRFTTNPQVVTKETLTGRCYWQVLSNYEHVFAIAVCYRSIRRGGPFNRCFFGHNDASWLLRCYSDGFDFLHDSYRTHIKFEGSESYPSPSKMGIFVDYDAGILAFYKIFPDDEVLLIYTVKTTFTQPLVAGVLLEDVNSSVELL